MQTLNALLLLVVKFDGKLTIVLLLIIFDITAHSLVL